MARLDLQTTRRLNYGDIDLIPVVASDRTPPGRSFKGVLAGNLWHVPGRVVKSTHELITLAATRGVRVSITVGDLSGSTRTCLN